MKDATLGNHAQRQNRCGTIKKEVNSWPREKGKNLGWKKETFKNGRGRKHRTKVIAVRIQPSETKF